MNRFAAIVLSAGSGTRMKSDIPKQYLPLEDKPVIYYSLKAFEESDVEEIILVTGAGDIEYCKTQIVEKFHFNKVKAIVPGGKERYDSVYEGICAAKDADYVLIHDGARPLVTQEIISRSMETVEKENACVVGMPLKDTIKMIDEHQYANGTPDRNRMWMVQTPQSFGRAVILKAYDVLHAKEKNGERIPTITDDAMLVEQLLGEKVKLIEGSYENIKITTPEDIAIATLLLHNREDANRLK